MAESSAPVRTPNAKKQRAPSAQHPKTSSTRTVSSSHDGALSDSALVYSSTASPRPSRRQKQRPADTKGGASPSQKHATPGGTQTRTRQSASNGAVMIPPGVKEDIRYAGATFSASPAAASLPVPRFAARSASNVTGSPNFARQKMREPQSEVFDSSPEVVPVSPAMPPSSPLDLLFKADRAEKARTMNANIGGQCGALPNGKNIFSDGSMGDIAGRLDTPGGNSSPRPGMGDRSLSSPGACTPPANDEARQAATKSLKELLFGQPLSPTATPPPPFVMDDARTSKTPDGTLQSYHNRSPPGPFTPPPEQHNQAAYHYGNRNLSPLFKAARGDTPNRPSSLNHVMAPYHEGPPGNSNQLPNQYPSSNTNHFPYAQMHPGGQQQTMPRQAGNNQPFVNQQFAQQSSNGYGNWAAPASPQRPRPNGGLDTSAMENDLRRILKLS